MTRSAQERSRWNFSRTLGVLIVAIGAVAIFGPETAHVLTARSLGLLLILTGVLGLLSLSVARGGRPVGAVLAWSLLSLAIGAAIQIVPVHGVASFGILFGLMFFGHGLAAAMIAARKWSAMDIWVLGGSLATAFLVLLGLALLFGAHPGDQNDEIFIGLDLVLFGAYVTLGREVVNAERSPKTSSR
jgi:uncharacterized membrane protein HdeD (DUF308 family)